MAKRFLSFLAALLLLVSPALGEMTVERKTGERYYPQEKDWVYHFSYAYPHIAGDDYTAAHINDTYEMALDEWAKLMLPMFANAPDMRYDGKNEVTHDFTVVCNNGRVLSILQTRVQTRGESGPLYALEPLTFDVGGAYAGESLTLRGVTLIQAGVDGDLMEDAEPDMYPEVARIIGGSSDEMAEALLPVLYERFQEQQGAGVIAAHWTREDFEDKFSPTQDFYTDEEGRIVFFFPPELLSVPSFEVPVFSFTPAELDALLAGAD
ncbi:MAG: hypothetical protein IJQ62_08285 [Clostridia bacterium]|nr:hypothetical protein [Clostridia bacterium]